ncbi:TetR/AcrR family transcriptional regulator [Nakamurella sp.]|uniref:TetR/AcrR family transcriptional regulator n=1 Tax=Nakamurella sp. TaxID=1869182 RepID=UPI00378330EA
MTKTSPGRAPSGGMALPPAGDRRPLLPLAGDRPPALRADAARNRAKLLTAAAALFRQKGVDTVSLDEIVRTAGVGKGTLFRTFGDKSGLAAALLDERERELQQRILFGPPPLGPGAGPVKRIVEFVREYVGYVADHIDLVRMSQTARPDARFDTGAHQFWRTHLVYLAGEAGHPDPRLVADVVLAAVTAEQIGYWIRRDGRTVGELADRLAGVAETLACRSPRGDHERGPLPSGE